MSEQDDRNLVPISIRLNKSTVSYLKALARLTDTKYQVLARQALHQWLTETKRDYIAFREKELENTEENK